MSYSTEQWIEILLGRWIRKGYAPIISLAPDPSALPLLLEPDERCVADVRCITGEHVFLTNRRLLLVHSGNVTAVPYRDILEYHWVTDSPDLKLAGELKHIYHDRLILDCRHGRKVVLEDLGQAVYPLMRVIHFLLKQKRAGRAV